MSELATISIKEGAWRNIGHITIISVVTAAFFNWSGVGYIGSDDTGYIEAAREWVRNFPFISGFFGDLRHPAVLPIAASIALLGDNELVVSLPNFFYSVGAVLLTFWLVGALTDRATASIATLLLVVSPLLSELSTTPGVDVCELFFVSASLLTFLNAVKYRKGWQLYFIAGVAAGLGFLARESTLALLIVYAGLFVIGFGGRRRVFWVMAAGFAAVFISEMLIYALTVGDPFHRIKLVVVAAQSPVPTGATGMIDFGSTRIFNLWPVIDPFIFALAHPKLGLIFPLAIFALVWSFRTRVVDETKIVARVFLFFAATSFLVGAFILGHLELLPRYFLLSVFGSIVGVAIWLRSGLWPVHKRSCILLLCALIAASMIGTLVSNKSFLFAERVLAELAASGLLIHTDAETAFRGRMLYEWVDARESVSSTPPKAGDLFLFNPKYAGLRTPRLRGIDVDAYVPKSDWIVIETFEQPPRVLGLILRAMGLEQRLPTTFVQRVSGPGAPVLLYRVVSP